MDDTPQDEKEPLPGHLRLLRNLVTALTVVMILGVITIVALLVIRLSDAPAPRLAFPEGFALPEGVRMTGYSETGNAVVIVADDGIIRVFDIETGALQDSFDTN